MNFWELPYCYILTGIQHSNTLRRRELHENEIPVSLLAYQQAEMNRDRKKSKKPFVMSDFYCYAMEDEIDSIDGIYGAAALRLIELRKFPSWGLFVYKDLMKNANNVRPPSVLCYMHEDAIILAPRITDSHCTGLLIATENVSSRIVTFKTMEGEEAVRVRMPILQGKTVAIENCYLDLA